MPYERASCLMKGLLGTLNVDATLRTSALWNEHLDADATIRIDLMIRDR